MGVAMREGLLHHRPSDGAILVGNGRAHTLHGDVRCLGRVGTHAIDNQGELRKNVRIQQR
jgi:hypothetical protein